jgi:hypothetical protein
MLRPPTAEQIPLREATVPYAGQWVAIDFDTHEVRAAAPTLAELSSIIEQRALPNIAVMRAFYPDEPDYIGLG